MHLYSVSQELYIFLACVYGGLLIGFVYDIYKIFRLVFNPKKIATMLQDLIFWIIISCIAFYILIWSNKGVIRFYNYLGFILGAFAYYHVLSKAITKTILFILQSIRTFVIDLFKLVTYPLRVVACLFQGPYSYCKKKTKPVYYKSKKIVKMPYKSIIKTKRNVKLYFTKK
ncbi:spore cortex biosynthesis protein YabQ [Serpentinicella sp. ANB-PHB4]|uniref:spore cortex biosynthesis protein YabQ n=1 Tax=Serpentinicella sp. ANB-PHB4 TaxID=3074076 RepID=UPI002855DFD9|nr:spore cortex biosynthesis protein YabQ [Serpentinicella sp. ANB-PHB4]MDR5659178.1 spore cortex biosynthesis protein YabQ [Serpentinicella sp. ANB-PHB4]